MFALVSACVTLGYGTICDSSYACEARSPSRGSHATDLAWYASMHRSVPNTLLVLYDDKRESLLSLLSSTIQTRARASARVRRAGARFRLEQPRLAERPIIASHPGAPESRKPGRSAELPRHGHPPQGGGGLGW